MQKPYSNLGESLINVISIRNLGKSVDKLYLVLVSARANRQLGGRQFCGHLGYRTKPIFKLGESSIEVIHI